MLFVSKILCILIFLCFMAVLVSETPKALAAGTAKHLVVRKQLAFGGSEVCCLEIAMLPM